MPTPLVSLADVKTHLPIKEGVTTWDARLSLLIETATYQIETATERSFTSDTYTQITGTPLTESYGYDFAGTRNESGYTQQARPAHYSLKTLNIVPASLEVYYDPSGAFPATSRIDAANLTLDANKGLLTIRIPMIRTIAGLKIVYTGGYAAANDTLSASIPPDLKMACISQVLYLWARMDHMNVGRNAEKKEGEGPNTFTAKGGLTPEAAALLVSYRTLRVSRE